MFNLLPDNLKKKIKTEYSLRRLIVVIFSVVFVQVVCLVFLFPSWLISSYKEDDIISQTEEMSKSELLSSASSTASDIISINSKLNAIDSSLSYLTIIPYINGIISNKTGDIHISDFTYTSNSSTTGTITLNGVSLTRESLVGFVKSLEGSDLFKSVDLPISNFAKDRNINFSININIEKQNV